jgi:hypothetical protein
MPLILRGAFGAIVLSGLGEMRAPALVAPELSCGMVPHENKKKTSFS